MNKTFNMIIAGVGGQGLITLLDIIACAAFWQGFDVKTSELHGLSQRGGSVNVHIRFGKKSCSAQQKDTFCSTAVYAPIVPKGKADLILALEFQESLNALVFANAHTFFVINNYQTPTLGESVSYQEVESEIKKITEKIFTLPFSQHCQQKLQNDIPAGIAMLGFAVQKGLLAPLTKEALEYAIQEVIAPKHYELNKQAFQLGISFGVQ